MADQRDMTPLKSAAQLPGIIGRYRRGDQQNGKRGEREPAHARLPTITRIS